MRTSSSTRATTPPVLVAVDGSAAALHALTWAAQEAVGRQAGLRIVHVYPGQPMWDPATTGLWVPEERRLRDHALRVLGAAEQFVHSIAPDLDVRAVLRRGGAARAIRSEGKRAGLIVLGRGPVHPRSVTSRVLARASSPVSVVGSVDPSHCSPSADRVVAVLLPDQGTSTVLAVLDTALTLARRRAWPLTVMADWDDVWAAGLSRAVLLTRARMACDVDVETASLPEPGCALPASCFSRAMVVLAPERRRRVPAVLDRPVLSAATSATFVSRRHAISERLREGSR